MSVEYTPTMKVGERMVWPCSKSKRLTQSVNSKGKRYVQCLEYRTS